jgi:hypothetical protein
MVTLFLRCTQKYINKYVGKMYKFLKKNPDGAPKGLRRAKNKIKVEKF